MSDKKSLKACVVGATGFAGAELCRLILEHPFIELVMATDRKQAGTQLKDIYPAFLGMSDIVLTLPEPADIAAVADVAFLAVPHTASLELTPALLRAGVTVIDLSADYRIKDPQIYTNWYGVKHSSADLLKDAVYGLPELNRASLLQLGQSFASGSAVLVAVPGCYPTATALAAIPALSAGIVSDDLVISDAISGVSGAGRTPCARTHFCHANESLEAYGVTTHRHTPEMEQTLTQAAGKNINVIFTPHLAPLTRGLLATVYMHVQKDISADALYQIYADYYCKEPFVQLLQAPQMPSTASVARTPYAQLGVALDERRCHMAIVSCAIDNLGKGAATQAIQAANIVCGFAETSGLTHVSSGI